MEEGESWEEERHLPGPGGPGGPGGPVGVWTYQPPPPLDRAAGRRGHQLSRCQQGRDPEVALPPSAARGCDEEGLEMRVHVVEVGWIQWPKGWFRSRTWGQVMRSLLRGLGGPADAIPILSYVVEHDDGHLVIDSGASHAVAERLRSSRVTQRLHDVRVEANEEVGPQMRARGLRPEDVRLVLPTHLHFDHVGGIGHFPNAEVLVHRAEWEGRKKKFGYEWRIQEEESWPASLRPSLYDLVPEPYGPFDHSLRLTDGGDVAVLPTPGHTKAHVALAVRTTDLTLLFSGDHVMRQSWYAADLSRGMHPVNFHERLTDDTNRRLHQFVEQFPTLLLPSHDAEAAQNLARWEPLRIT